MRTHTGPTRPSAAHTPEPGGYNDRAIVQDVRGRMIADCEILTTQYDGTGLPEEEVANARRIVAAVNACEGLSTEALERGVVAELCHALGIVLDAAGDLDAAIDEATDQFDDERARLNAACRHARAALGAGTPLLQHELLASRGQIALVWGVKDVQEVRPDLTEEEAWAVLYQADRHHATQGVSWDTLESFAEDLFGPAPEAAAKEE